jgi:hypothetical protein
MTAAQYVHAPIDQQLDQARAGLAGFIREPSESRPHWTDTTLTGPSAAPVTVTVPVAGAPAGPSGGRDGPSTGSPIGRYARGWRTWSAPRPGPLGFVRHRGRRRGRRCDVRRAPRHTPEAKRQRAPLISPTWRHPIYAW